MLQILKELDHYDRFKRQDQPLEMVHLKLRTLIQGMAVTLKTPPDNHALKDRLSNLQEELAELERQAPWIMRDYPVEMCL